MSEKAHIPAFAKHPPHPWKGLAWLLPCWLGLLILIYLLSYRGGAILDSLARNDPDPERHQKVQGLLAARALLAPASISPSGVLPAPSCSSPSVSEGQLLWEARRSGESTGFFLAGAVRAERLGRPAEARLWLSMELLARGKPKEARTMLDSVPTSAPLALPELANWESSELGKRLRESLGK